MQTGSRKEDSTQAPGAKGLADELGGLASGVAAQCWSDRQQDGAIAPGTPDRAPSLAREPLEKSACFPGAGFLPPKSSCQ